MNNGTIERRILATRIAIPPPAVSSGMDNLSDNESKTSEKAVVAVATGSGYRLVL